MSANETESQNHPHKPRRRRNRGSHPHVNQEHGNVAPASRFRSALSSLTLKNIGTLAFGVAIGTSPIVAGMVYMDRSVLTDAISHITSVAPTTAIEAVKSRLPQVAILGEKDAPAGMTEVFIQVPGVLNMQSVYVLADNKTVISGILLPEDPTVSVVAGPQLTMPTGMPTVEMAMPSTSGVSGPAVTYADPSPATAAPVPASPVAQPASVPAASAPVVMPSASDIGAGQPAIGSEEFAKQIVESIKNNEDSLITAVKSAKTDKDQQNAYWNAVTSVPSIKQGNGKRQLYVFFDPNCPVCHQFFGTIESKLVEYDLTVNWIPVVIFTNKPSSVTVAATLLNQLQQSNNQALSTLRQFMVNPSVIDQIHNQYTEDRNVMLPQVVTNTSLMTLAKAGTPLLVYKDYSDNLAISLNLANEGQLAQIKSS